MKRSGPLRRHTEMPRTRKPIPLITVARAKRRRDAYDAHLKSAHFRWVKQEVRKRSGGRCEREFRVSYRCRNDATVFNHKTYIRLGKERPEDIEHLCSLCNSEYESQRPWRAQRRAALKRAAS
jgi:hypothetical protein